MEYPIGGLSPILKATCVPGELLQLQNIFDLESLSELWKEGVFPMPTVRVLRSPPNTDEHHGGD